MAFVGVRLHTVHLRFEFIYVEETKRAYNILLVSVKLKERGRMGHIGINRRIILNHALEK